MKTQYLPVQLTPEERAVRSGELAEAIDEHRQEEARLDQLVEAHKGAKKQIEAELEERIAQVRRLAATVRTGYEQRLVEVEERADDERSVIDTYRLDTGDRVGTRPMGDKELQEREARKQRLLFEDVRAGVARAGAIRSGYAPSHPKPLAAEA